VVRGGRNATRSHPRTGFVSFWRVWLQRTSVPSVSNRFVATITLVADRAARESFRVALIGGFALPFLGVTRATGDVDFLADAAGSDALHDALTAKGFTARHRTADVANYAAPGPFFAPVDFVFSRRPATQAMLDRALVVELPDTAARVARIDAEGIIGLKAQALANDPRRRRQDEADIVALLRANAGRLDLALVRAYFEAFDMADLLARLLEESR
jgi:hypothetical protein